MKKALINLFSPVSKNLSVWLIFLVTSLLLSFVLPSVLHQLVRTEVYSVGSLAVRSVRANKDFLVEETADQFQRRKAKIVLQAEKVFTLTFPGPESLSSEIEAAFTAASELGAEPSVEQVTEFQNKLGLEFKAEELKIIKDYQRWSEVSQEVLGLIIPVLRTGVISNKRVVVNSLASGNKLIIRDLTFDSEKEINSASEVYDLSEAAAVLESSIPTSGYKKGKAFDRLVFKLAKLTMRPNLTFDGIETERRIQSALNSLEKVFFQVRKGEMIVRGGDIVTVDQNLRLLQLSASNKTVDYLETWIAYSLLTFLILFCSHSFSARQWPAALSSPRDIAVICATLIFSFSFLKLFTVLAESVSSSMYYIDPSTFALASPVAAGGILLQIILGAPAVSLYVIVFTLLAGIFVELSWVFLALIALGNMVASISIRGCVRRSEFIWAGIRIASVNMIIVLCFLLLNLELDATEQASRVLWAVLGGLFSGVLGASLIPIAELCGSYVTDIKLLELSSIDHPLLKDLSIAAPGTWNHSTVMSQMAEAAAEAIGANPLLAKVAAYFHDVGKITKPGYFVENQTKENKHDKLTPSMSALIIKAHVKDGIELAEKHKVPASIVDFIPQHHGTSLIEYFYIKALKDAGEEEEVEESHYRYPGPKPQTKEAGILMLADSIEASSRTLSDPSPAKIQGLVQKMINKIFASGELDESNLTLKDLHLIAKSFVRVLTGIYHRRVEYAEPAEKVREPVLKEDESQRKDEKKKEKGVEKSSDTLKRLGI